MDDGILGKYDLICKMGRGNYGTVWRAIDKSNRERLAIKKINGAFAKSRNNSKVNGNHQTKTQKLKEKIRIWEYAKMMCFLSHF